MTVLEAEPFWNDSLPVPPEDVQTAGCRQDGGAARAAIDGVTGHCLQDVDAGAAVQGDPG